MKMGESAQVYTLPPRPAAPVRPALPAPETHFTTRLHVLVAANRPKTWWITGHAMPPTPHASHRPRGRVGRCETPRDARTNRSIGWPLQGPACHSCPVRKATEDKENRSSFASGPPRAPSPLRCSRPSQTVPLSGTSPRRVRPRGSFPPGTPTAERRLFSGAARRKAHSLRRLPTGGEVRSCGGVIHPQITQISADSGERSGQFDAEARSPNL